MGIIVIIILVEQKSRMRRETSDDHLDTKSVPESGQMYQASLDTYLDKPYL